VRQTRANFGIGTLAILRLELMAGFNHLAGLHHRDTREESERA
jgi:hypothetical protein